MKTTKPVSNVAKAGNSWVRPLKMPKSPVLRVVISGDEESLHTTFPKTAAKPRFLEKWCADSLSRTEITNVQSWHDSHFTKPEGLGEWLECQLCALGISVRRRACLEPFSPFWGQFLRFWTESCPLGNSLKTYVCVAICAVSWLSVCLSVSWVLLVVFHW